MDNKKDDILLNICAETQGCVEMDLETNERQENCVYSRLIAAGYSSDILSSADERGSAPINFLYNVVNPERLQNGGGVVGKMDPKCLSIVSIIQNANSKLLTWFLKI